jgi:hypothetical protein
VELYSGLGLKPHFHESCLLIIIFIMGCCLVELLANGMFNAFGSSDILIVVFPYLICCIHFFSIFFMLGFGLFHD